MPDAGPGPTRRVDAAVKAIVLAAGRGERMRPLTDRLPKPLLPVAGRPLIEWHLLALARAGVREVVVNTAWQEARIVAALGDGARFGIAIRYSQEGRDHGGALETAGGIATALPLLVDGAGNAEAPFWIVSADIWAPDFGFDAGAAARFATDAAPVDAHVWLVPNPPYHPRGDFVLGPDGRLSPATDDRAPGERRGTWTYANLALAHPRLVASVAAGTRAPLGPLLIAGAATGRISAEAWSGDWENVGTPAQLEALNARLGALPTPPAAR